MRTVQEIYGRVLLVVFILLLSAPAFAADVWESTLTVSVLQGKNKLYFGQRADATDAIDGKYDAPAMLAGGIKASFVTSKGAYWRDIKALDAGSKVWKLHLESSINDTIFLRWKPEALPKNRTVVLTNADGVRIDMISASEYSYQNEGPADFLIEVGER
jgi:hypothetical protein